MMYYSYVREARDQVGNIITHGDLKEGKEPLLIPKYEYVESAGQILATEIQDVRDKYTLEFNKENVNEMLQYIDDDTKFYIHDSGILYTTRQDLWCNKSIEDAVEFNKTGRISK